VKYTDLTYLTYVLHVNAFCLFSAVSVSVHQKPKSAPKFLWFLVD